VSGHRDHAGVGDPAAEGGPNTLDADTVSPTVIAAPLVTPPTRRRWPEVDAEVMTRGDRPAVGDPAAEGEPKTSMP